MMPLLKIEGKSAGFRAKNVQVSGHLPAELVGIVVIVREESYTSKASFLDRDEIPTYDGSRKGPSTFSGKRETRGLYRASNGRRIQADINGSYNILRKAFPQAFSDSWFARQEIAGTAVSPRRLAVSR
jgi:transposase